jgi:hypothetical protein
VPVDEKVPRSVLEAAAMIGYLMGAGLEGVGVVAGVILVLGLVALIRCRKEDIPAIVRALASWWRK